MQLRSNMGLKYVEFGTGNRITQTVKYAAMDNNAKLPQKHE